MKPEPWSYWHSNVNLYVGEVPQQRVRAENVREYLKLRFQLLIRERQKGRSFWAVSRSKHKKQTSIAKNKINSTNFRVVGICPCLFDVSCTAKRHLGGFCLNNPSHTLLCFENVVSCLEVRGPFLHPCDRVTTSGTATTALESRCWMSGSVPKTSNERSKHLLPNIGLIQIFKWERDIHRGTL